MSNKIVVKGSIYIKEWIEVMELSEANDAIELFANREVWFGGEIPNPLPADDMVIDTISDIRIKNITAYSSLTPTPGRDEEFARLKMKQFENNKAAENE